MTPSIQKKHWRKKCICFIRYVLWKHRTSQVVTLSGKLYRDWTTSCLKLLRSVAWQSGPLCLLATSYRYWWRDTRSIMSTLLKAKVEIVAAWLKICAVATVSDLDWKIGRISQGGSSTGPAHPVVSAIECPGSSAK